MANKVIDTISRSILSGIADAIRLKSHSEDEIASVDMPEAIRNININGTPREKTITDNGTYVATDEGYDAYSSVKVNIAGTGGGGYEVENEVSESWAIAVYDNLDNNVTFDMNYEIINEAEQIAEE